MNVEQRPSSKELGETLKRENEETRRIREESRPLKLANLLGRLIEVSTDTKTKKIGGFAGMMGVVILSMIIDGNFAIVTAETLAVLGGATIGEKIPLTSWLPEFIKEKKAIKAVRKKNYVSPKEIASMLSKFPDVVDQKEVELWPSKQLGEESLNNPKRYRIVRAVLDGSQKDPSLIIEDFMQAQVIAQEERRTKKYMRREAWKKGADIGGGIVLMVGITSLASFGFGYQAQAGIIGLGDDAILYGVLAYSFAKQKIKSFLSNY